MAHYWQEIGALTMRWVRVDVLLQISAVQGALEQVSKILMARHIQTCVQDSLRAGSQRERSQKIDELVRVFTRHSGLDGR